MEVAAVIFSISFACMVIGIFIYAFAYVKPKDPPKIEINIPEIPKDIKFTIFHQYPEKDTGPVKLSEEEEKFLKEEEERKEKAKKMTEEFQDMSESVEEYMEDIMNGKEGNKRG